MNRNEQEWPIDSDGANSAREGARLLAVLLLRRGLVLLQSSR
jgi:hypothetical protein